MNAQDLNHKQNRLTYQKDYTKLESIFDAAVERMHRKKIIYYATDRIYSEDSRKLRARESFKEKAWAKPVSSEDIKTEVIQLAKENVIPISDTILNDDPSMIAFLELVGEDNIEMVEEVNEPELVEQPVVAEEEPPVVEAVRLKDLVEPEEVNEEAKVVSIPDYEDSAEAVILADLISEEPEIETEQPEVKPAIKEEKKVEPKRGNIYQYYQKIKAQFGKKESAEVSQEETLINEESATEKTGVGEQLELEPEESTDKAEIIEEVEQSPDELKLSEAVETENVAEESGDYLEADYDRFLEFSNQILEDDQIPDDMTLGELLASIQEDDSYLQRDETVKEQVAEEEVFSETETYETELEPVEDQTITIEEPLDELEEEAMQSQESPLDIEIKESKPKRRIQLDEVETQDLYTSKEEIPNKKKLTNSMIEKINGAKKEYMLSRISFFVALFLTGVFSVLFFQSFNGIDYISLILSLVGAFLVWDLSSKRILIMTGLIEAAIIASMIYLTNSTGMQLDYFHYVWLLIVPLMICSSFIFKKSRENYASIINGKDVNLETN